MSTFDHFQRIGSGFCGSVWAYPDCHPSSPDHNQPSSLVMKREDGGPGRSLRIEYQIYHRLNQQKPPSHLNIPTCYDFIEEKDTDTWSKLLPQFPPGFLACNALVMDKIPPLPEAVRRRLVENYCLPRLRPSILEDDKNTHCLARVYLGRRRRHRVAQENIGRPTFFSLRNFPLHIDQMEALGLADLTIQYTCVMADSLSFMHWVARIDANDVEYVLAPPPARPDISFFDSPALGQHAIWMLDFDCCRELPMNKAGIGIAARCFWRNDPFYPRPGSGNTIDEALWQRFRARFLATSINMLQRESSAVQILPSLLMDRIEATRGVYSRG